MPCALSAQTRACVCLYCIKIEHPENNERKGGWPRAPHQQQPIYAPGRARRRSIDTHTIKSNLGCGAQVERTHAFLSPYLFSEIETHADTGMDGWAPRARAEFFADGQNLHFGARPFGIHQAKNATVPGEDQQGMKKSSLSQPSDVFPTYSQLFLISIPLAGANGESHPHISLSCRAMLIFGPRLLFYDVQELSLVCVRALTQ